MRTFFHNKKNYKVISEFSCPNHEGIIMFQTIQTSETRKRRFFTWKPLKVRKKFRWFTYVTVKESLHFFRTKEFDDGWSYSYYWVPWKTKWVIDEIL